MGYYTDYEIKVIGGSVDNTVFISKFKEVTGYPIGGDFCFTGKWYNYHKDMLQLSELFSCTTFKFSCIGEDRGDEWCIYYKNGKFQNAELRICKTMDNFDESKLK